METLIAFGSEIKTLEDSGNHLKIGGYLVLFGSPEEHDATRLKDYFTSSTDFDIPESGATSTVYYHHGLNSTLKARPLGKALLSIGDAGVWMEAELRARDEYEAKIQELVRQGKLGLSSGTASHLVERTAVKNAYGEEVHRIDRWPLGLDASLTPAPGEPRTRALCLKSLDEVALEGWDCLVEGGSSGVLGQAVLAEYVRVQAGLSGVEFEVPVGLKGVLWEESKHPRDERGRWMGGGLGRLAPLAELRPVGELRSNPFRKKRNLHGRDVNKLMPSQPHPFKAEKIPVRNAIEFRSQNHRIRNAYGIIHLIHGDGNLPKNPIYLTDAVWHEGMEVTGLFTPNSPRGRCDIRISKKSPSRILSVIHETAHFLDFAALPGSKPGRSYGTDKLNLQAETEHQPKEWQNFHSAVTRSEAWKRLVELSNNTVIEDINPVTGQRHIYNVDPGKAKYYMMEPEVFARAYAQYVAIRCPDPLIGLHLRSHIAEQAHHDDVTASGGATPDSIHYPLQWKKDDFEPIAKAIDELLLDAGWMSPQGGVKTMSENEDAKAESAKRAESAREEAEIMARVRARRQALEAKGYVFEKPNYMHAIARDPKEIERLHQERILLDAEWERKKNAGTAEIEDNDEEEEALYDPYAFYLRDDYKPGDEDKEDE